MEPRLNAIIEKAVEESRASKKDKSAPTKIVTTKADQIYHKKISYIVSLLTPLLVAPLPDGDIIIRYPIEDETYRLQLQDYIMTLTKKHLKL